MIPTSRGRKLAAALLALLAAACTKIGGSNGMPGGNPGLLRIATSRFDNLNTVLSGGGSSTYLSYLWGAYLFLADDKGRLVPELATDIPSIANHGISADGLTITYHLRRGVVWHDGSPFDARDVVFTWRAIMNPKNNVITRLGYDKIAAMKVVNPYTLEVKLKQPYAPAVASFFGPGEVPMPILPQHILASLPDINQAAYNRKPVGTGPFIIDSYESGSGVRLTANARYWRGRPKLHGIDFMVVPDPNTTVIMLRSDELDVANVSDAHAALLEKVQGIRIVREPANQDVYLSFNTTHTPFDDVSVRRAIAMGVDRKFYVQAFQYGTGAIADSDQPAFLPWYDPNVRAPAYDPAQAGRLLDAAGWRAERTGYRSKGGRQFALIFSYIADREPDRSFAPVFQSEMKHIGIAVALKPYPYNIFYAQKAQGGVLTGGRYDMAFTGWVGGSDPDDAALWMCDQRPPQGYNTAFLCDRRIDAAENAALRTYEFDARRRAYWRIQELLAEEVPVVFLSWTDIVYAARNSVKDFMPGENYWNSWNWRKE